MNSSPNLRTSTSILISSHYTLLKGQVYYLQKHQRVLMDALSASDVCTALLGSHSSRCSESLWAPRPSPCLCAGLIPPCRWATAHRKGWGSCTCSLPSSWGQGWELLPTREQRETTGPWTLEHWPFVLLQGLCAPGLRQTLSGYWKPLKEGYHQPSESSVGLHLYITTWPGELVSIWEFYLCLQAWAKLENRAWCK